MAKSNKNNNNRGRSTETSSKEPSIVEQEVDNTVNVPEVIVDENVTVTTDVETDRVTPSVDTPISVEPSVVEELTIGNESLVIEDKPKEPLTNSPVDYSKDRVVERTVEILDAYKRGMMGLGGSVKTIQQYGRSMLVNIRNIENPMVAKEALEVIKAFYKENSEDFTSGYNLYRFVGDWNGDKDGLEKFNTMQMCFSIMAGNNEDVGTNLDVTNLIPALDLKGGFAAVVRQYKD